MRSALVPVLLNSAPGWVLPGASLDMDYANARAWVRGRGYSAIADLLTTTRASTGYAANSSGLLTSFATNTARITDLGLLVEEAATNVVLWNRDLTNAAWTKSNITPLLNQTGADGTANAATSLTATAGNGTCLQAITLASSARFQSAYVKRLTGTGTINMTMDNGVTWTAITVTAAYTQLTIPTQTLANPTVGFRIVTSGDAIAVDLVGNETGTFATSPIATTTVAVTRAADAVTFNSLNLPAPYSMFISVGSSASVSADLFLGGTANDGSLLRISGGGGVANVNEAGVATASITAGTVTANTPFKMAGRFAVNDSNLAVGGSLGTHDTSNIPPTLTALGFGRALYAFGSSVGSVYFKRAALFRSGLADAQLTTLST